MQANEYIGLDRTKVYGKSIDDCSSEEWNKASAYVGWAGAGGGQAGASRALDKQIAGSHYKKFKIQPAEFCYYNNIPYLEATAIKYLCRWKDKGGVEDLQKAKHFIDLLIEFQDANT